MDGAQVGGAEEFIVAFERVNRRRGHRSSGQHQQRSFQLVAQGGDKVLAATLQLDHVVSADPASHGSPHHAAIHALRVSELKDRAMFGIGLDRDQRAVLRGEGAHGADQGRRPRHDLGAGRREPFHGGFEIGRDRSVEIVNSSLVGRDEFDAVEIEGAHRSARLAAQGHVDQHAIFDSARQRTDRIEGAGERKYAALVDPPLARLEPDDSAEARWRPDRAAGVAADRARRKAGRNRNR